MTKPTAGRLLALCAALALSACGESPQAVDLLIENVRVYDGEGDTAQLADVAVTGGRFVAIDATAARRFAAARVIDGSGRYLTPGLWDAHAHVRSTSDGGLELQAFLRHGVTSIHDLGGFGERVAAARQQVEQDPSAGPRIYSAYTMLNGEVFADFQRAVVTEEEVAAAIAEQTEFGAAQIKVHRAFLPALLPAAVNAAANHNLGVTGHVPLGMHPLAACEAGMKGIEHVGSLPEALISLESFVDSEAAIEYLLSDAAAPLYRCLAERGVTLTPTLIIYPTIARRRAGDGPMPQEFVDFIAAMQAIAKRLHDEGVTLLAGTDVTDFGDVLSLQPGRSLHEELAMLHEAGIPATAVLKMATASPARAIGVDKDVGTIAPGKRADFLLLAADPGADVRNLSAILAVYRDGTEVYRSE